MAIATSILVSLAISVALSVAMRVIGALLTPQQSAPTIGGALQPAKDPGSQLTVRNPDQPHQVIFGTARVQGNVVFAHTTASNNLLHLMVVWAGHEVDGFEDLYFNDKLIPLDGSGNATGEFAGYAVCHDHLGAPDQLADADAIAAMPDKWTTEHRGRGRAYSYIRLGANRSLYQTGLPNIWRVVRGMKLYDPRDGTTSWSANASLAAAAWMNSDTFGRGVPYGGRNGLDTEALSAAANVSDEDVPLAVGGTEKRYTANGVLQSDQPFVDNLNRLLSASVGTAAPIGGQWVIDAAAWAAPELVLDESHFRSPFTLAGGIGNGEAFNAVKGKFRNPDKLYNRDDFPAIISPVYEIEDGGDGLGLGREFKDVDLEFTTSAATAQRLARIDLRQARQPISFTAQVKLIGLRLRAGNTVGIANSFVGWPAKAFRVNSLKMVLGTAPGANGGGGGGSAGGQVGIVGVDLELRETAAAIYDWDATLDEQASDPAPNTDLPNLLNPLPPSNLAVDENKYVTSDGSGVKVRADLTWESSPDGFVTLYRPGWRDAGGDWNTGADTPDRKASFLDMAPGAKEFRVGSVNFAGIVSSYIVLPRELTGLGDIPTDIAGLTAVPIGGLALLRWQPVPAVDLDVRIGGKILIRHSPATAGAVWAAAVPVGDELSGADTVAALPNKTGTFLVKARDSSGLYSANPAAVVMQQASLLAFTTPAGGSLVEEPAFAGAKTHCTVAAGILSLDAGQMSGSYAFHARMDLGSALSVRLTTNIAALVTNNVDTWDSTEACDSNSDTWDGALTGNEAAAFIWVRSTQTDPAGAPTWSAWQRLDSAEYSARGFEFRLDLAASVAGFGISISQLDVVAEQPL